MLEQKIWEDYIKEKQEIVPDQESKIKYTIEKAKTEAEDIVRNTLRDIEKTKYEIKSHSEQINYWESKLDILRIKVKELMEDNEILIIEEKKEQADESH